MPMEILLLRAISYKVPLLIVDNIKVSSVIDSAIYLVKTIHPRWLVHVYVTHRQTNTQLGILPCSIVSETKDRLCFLQMICQTFD